jgi:hypothetical protein
MYNIDEIKKKNQYYYFFLKLYNNYMSKNLFYIFLFFLINLAKL